MKFAENEIDDKYKKYINQILDVLGHPKALVTELSQINCFTSMGHNEEFDESVLIKIRKLMNRDVGYYEFIYKLAKELYLNERRDKMSQAALEKVLSRGEITFKVSRDEHLRILGAAGRAKKPLGVFIREMLLEQITGID